MENDLTKFGKTATGLSKSPLGIIALFIVLVYGFASIVVAIPNDFDTSERAPLVYFLVVFPCIVFFGFLWLVSKHPDKIYSPSDFKDEANFMKMKNELTELEKKGESEYAVQIVELKTDLEFLREKIDKSNDNTIDVSSSNAEQISVDAFMRAVQDYKNNSYNEDGWRKRVEVDKQLKSGVARPSVEGLEELLKSNPNDQEVEMASAAALGVQVYGEDDRHVAQLLIRLLGSQWERARYRAAQSIERIGNRADTNDDVRNFLLSGIEESVSSENAEVVRRELKKVGANLLSATYRFGHS